MKFYNFLILLISILTIFLIFCIMKEENGRLKKKSRVFEIAVKGGSKFYLSLGELETLLGWGYQK